MARSTKARTAELLGGLSLFSACSRRELAQFASLSASDELPAGTVLTREGAAGGIAYVIAAGRAEVLRSGRRLATLGPGDVVGELSLIDRRPRSATVRAVTDLEVIEIDGTSFARMLEKSASLRRKLLAALATRLRATEALPVRGL